MNKKILFSVLLGGAILSSVGVYANSEDSKALLENYIKNQEKEALVGAGAIAPLPKATNVTPPVEVPVLDISDIELQKPVEFHDEIKVKPPLKKEVPLKTFTMKIEEGLSCQALNHKFNRYLEDNKDLFKLHNPFLVQPMWKGIKGDLLMNASVEENTMNIDGVGKGELSGEVLRDGNGNDYSKTNIQKNGFDEPEILKISDSIVAYLHKDIGGIEIIEWSADKAEKKLISKINLPEMFTAHNMMFDNKTLIILGERTIDGKPMWYSNYTKTSIIFVNLINPQKPSLKHLVELGGSYQDARLRNGKLYVFGNHYFEFPYDYFFDKDGNQKSNKNFSFQNLIPSNVSSYIENGKIKVNSTPTDCSNVSLILPDREMLGKYEFDFNFSTISVVDINDYSFNQKYILGNSFERHVSNNGVYLINKIWNNSRLVCPNYMRCFIPLNIEGGIHNYSLINKFSFGKDNQIKYENSNLIPGYSLSQYSMDEDLNGNFRIITQIEGKGTNIYTFDKGLNLKGKLEYIQPDEDFKSSRFIDDKLYLVTFERTDPLFVVDLKNNIPVLLGELKIPGYSSYLHPYGKIKNGVQYLIGVGYDMIEGKHLPIPTGVKVDLYKVDYNTKPLSIKQIGTKTFGKKNSYSSAQEDPRSFVWDEKNQNLILPLLEVEQEEAEICNFIKQTVNGKLEEIKKCHTANIDKPTFMGTKVLKLTTDGKIEEIGKIDALNMSLKKLSQIEQEFSTDNFYRLRQLMETTRSGYIGKNYFFINDLGFVDKDNTLHF